MGFHDRLKSALVGRSAPDHPPASGADYPRRPIAETRLEIQGLAVRAEELLRRAKDLEKVADLAGVFTWPLEAHTVRIADLSPRDPEAHQKIGRIVSQLDEIEEKIDLRIPQEPHRSRSGPTP